MSAASTAATIVQIKKRDGRLVPFDQSKIADAILKAFQATYQPDSGPVAAQLAEEVRTLLEVDVYKRQAQLFAHARTPLR